MNAAFDAQLQSELDALKAAGTYKHLRHLTTPMAPEVHMEEAGDVIVLSSNNYLGLSDQAEVVEAGIEGLRKYGAGTASVRFICGTFDIHRTLEDRIASFLGTQASLTFVSCWNANTGLFATVCGEGSAIISDELNHASIIDGVQDPPIPAKPFSTAFWPMRGTFPARIIFSTTYACWHSRSSAGPNGPSCRGPWTAAAGYSYFSNAFWMSPSIVDLSVSPRCLATMLPLASIMIVSRNALVRAVGGRP